MGEEHASELAEQIKQQKREEQRIESREPGEPEGRNGGAPALRERAGIDVMHDEAAQGEEQRHADRGNRAVQSERPKLRALREM
jgi:hypothetical protein